MIEPTMTQIYKLSRIVEPTWSVDPRDGLSLFVGRDKNLSGSQVVLRWIKLLGRRAYQRTSDGLYDIYTSGAFMLRIRIG